MSPNHSRRSRAGPSHDDPPSATRPRPVQKLVKDIPGELFSTWGERWTLAPPRGKSNKASTNSRPGVSASNVGHYLSEFQLDSPQTLLTPDSHAPLIVPVVHSHSVKRKSTKRKNKRMRKCAASSLHQSSSAPTRASTEETALDTPTFGSLSMPLQEEFVAPSATLSRGSITPDDVSYLAPDNRDFSIPMYSHYQHEVSDSSLTYHGFQILPYGASTIAQVPSYPDPTLRWTPGDEANFSLSAPLSYYHHDGNQSYVGAMGRGTFLNHSSGDPRLPHSSESEPYIRPRGQPLHQRQAFNIDIQDKHIPFFYNLDDTQS